MSDRHPQDIDVDSLPDVEAAYSEKVAEHAEVLANSWLTDWGKLIDKAAEKAGTTRDQMLLFEIVMFLKAIHKETKGMSYDTWYMHLHKHGIMVDNCPINEHYKGHHEGEEWKK